MSNTHSEAQSSLPIATSNSLLPVGCDHAIEAGRFAQLQQPPRPEIPAKPDPVIIAGRIAAGDFPIGSLGPIFQEWSKEIAAEGISYYDMPGNIAFASISMAAGRGIGLDVGRGLVFANTLVTIVGDTGCGKKAANYAKVPFADLQERTTAIFQANDLPELLTRKNDLEHSRRKGEITTDGYRELNQITEQIENWADEWRYLVADFTPAVLRKMVARAQKCLAVFSADGRTVIENMGGALTGGKTPQEHILTQLFGGESDLTDRSSTNERTDADGGRIGMFIAAQPDIVKKMLSCDRNLNGGFSGRCMMAVTERRPNFPHLYYFGDAAVKTNFNAAITALLRRYRPKPMPCAQATACFDGESPFVVTLTAEAKSYLFELIHSMEARLDCRTGRIRGIMHKIAIRWSEILWKTVLVTHLSVHLDGAHNVPVALDTARAAAQIWRYYCWNILTFMTADRAEDFDTLSNALVECVKRSFERGNKKGMTMANFKQFYPTRSQTSLAAVLDRLVRNGRLVAKLTRKKTTTFSLP